MQDENENSNHRNLMEVVDGLARHMADSRFPRGDLAALRRAQSKPLAFWKFTTQHNLKTGTEEDENNALTILQILAIMVNLHAKDVELGVALVNAGFSELRCARLLRSEGDALKDNLVSTARYLAAKEVSADIGQLASLLLTANPQKLEALRRRIARTFFKALHTQNKKSE
jgi:CRISPR type I-E-associated protein CasB/Cse2